MRRAKIYVFLRFCGKAVAWLHCTETGFLPPRAPEGVLEVSHEVNFKAGKYDSLFFENNRLKSQVK